MTRSVTITLPVADMDQANVDLEAAGFGSGNFSVPLREAGASVAKEAGCHWWATPDEITTIKGLLPTATFSERDLDDAAGIGAEHFRKVVQDRALDWSDPRKWATTMAGERKTAGGREWESGRDFNPWPAGTKANKAWAEV